MSQRQVATLKAGCDHNAPIVVPCDDCVHQRLSRILIAEKEDLHRAVRSATEELVNQTANTAGALVQMRSQYEKSVNEAAKLSGELMGARRRTAELQAQLSDLESRLAAERSTKLPPVLVHDEEEYEA